MRVVIIGMFQSERQVDKSLYPHLLIRFANKGKDFGIGQDDLINTADVLIVMTKFVAHKATEKLDRTKTRFVNGGITRLREMLANLNATAKIDVPEPAAITVAAAPTEEEEEMTKYDWSDFKKAKAGDVLTYHRPAKMTIAKWETTIALTRSYYKRNYGVFSESEFKDGKVNILITKVEGKPGAKEAKKTKAAAERAGMLEGQVGPAPATGLPIADAPPPASQPHFGLGTNDRQFWTQVYLTSMHNNPGMQPSDHVFAANSAIDALVKKMGHG